MPILNMIYGSGWGGGWLPPTFQQVEYIQTTGSQYIKSWYIPQSWDTAEISFNMLTFTWDEQWILAVWSSPNGYRAWIDHWNWKTDNWFTYDTTWLNTDIIATWNCTHTFSREVFLFAQNENGTVYHLNKGTQRLYSCKIYRGWNLIRDYVPCYRKSDNEIWLFDIVNYTFFINSWTWTFIKWNDV